MSVTPTTQNTGDRTLTLGELLYADPAVALVSEKQWVTVVRAIAAGDEAALRLLYGKAFPVVFTYLMRLTGNRHLTDKLILDVFELVWCEAPVFETRDGPVLGWIMRQARSLALTRAVSGESTHADSGQITVELSTDPLLVGDDAHRAQASHSLQGAIDSLTLDERQAMEATFLNGMSYAEFATQCGQPIGTIKRRIRSGVAKLQHALQARDEET